MSQTDHKHINLQQDHELNDHLRKHSLSQSKENREKLVDLLNENREGNHHITHEEADKITQLNKSSFDPVIRR